MTAMLASRLSRAQSGYGRMPPQMTDMVRASGQSQGDIVDQIMLNRPVTSLLDDTVATLDGVNDEGLVQVTFVHNEVGPDGISRRVAFFDEDNVLRKAVVTVSSMGQSMDMEVAFKWRPVSDTDARLLQAGATVPAMQQETTYEYTTVGGLHILTAQKNQIFGQSINLKFADVTVNGEPLAAAKTSDG